MLTFDNV